MKVRTLRMGAVYNCDITLEEYLEKSHNKTASLIAASCKSAAVFSDVTEDVKMDMYEYGKHLGLAFQVSRSQPHFASLSCPFIRPFQHLSWSNHHFQFA